MVKIFRRSAAGKYAPLIQISVVGTQARHPGNMEHKELLIARIALYRRYLSEGTDSDLARAYLWLIRQDEAKLKAIAEPAGNEQEAGPAEQGPG